jgi:fucose permease
VFAEVASSDWSAVFLRDVTGAAAGAAALGVVAVAGAMALGRLSGDAVVRRLGPVTTVRTGGIVAFAGVVLLLTSSPAWLAIVAFGLIGLGVSTAVPLAFAAAGRIGGAHPGHQIAAVATIGYGAGMATPFLVGVITQFSSIQIAFGVVGLLTLVIVALAPRLRV